MLRRTDPLSPFVANAVMFGLLVRRLPPIPRAHYAVTTLIGASAGLFTSALVALAERQPPAAQT